MSAYESMPADNLCEGDTRQGLCGLQAPCVMDKDDLRVVFKCRSAHFSLG